MVPCQPAESTATHPEPLTGLSGLTGQEAQVPICVRIQAIWWQNPSPLDDEDDAHVKDHKIVKEAGTPDGDEKSKTFEEG